MENLKTVPEVAKYLRVQQSTLRRWIFERKIETVRIGRAVRIRQEVVDEMIERGIRKPISL